mgnify:CR=1 FL=1
MSITFLPEDRKQKYLLLLLGLLCVFAVFVAWYQFSRESSFFLPETQPEPPQQITIDFTIFEDPAFLELGNPRPAIPLPDTVGKRNPFVPSL